jgi:hypothetical protein
VLGLVLGLPLNLLWDWNLEYRGERDGVRSEAWRGLVIAERRVREEGPKQERRTLRTKAWVSSVRRARDEL